MKLAAVVAVAACVVLLGALVVASVLMGRGMTATTAAPMQATPPASAEPTGPEPAIFDESQEPPWIVVESGDERLTAETLPGTSWHAGPYTLSFRDNGTVVVNRRFEGAWRLVGDALIVEAQGQTLRGVLSGSMLTFEDREAERIEFRESPEQAPPRIVVR